MPYERLSMRKTREILRLSWSLKRSQREVARSVNAARSTVAECLRRAKMAGLGWPLPEDLDDRALEELLYPPPPPSATPRPMPDLAEVHRELRRHKHVTLLLLWQEYRQGHDDAYGYSRFCELYRAFEAQVDPVMRQEHPAGERVFVDFAGATIDIVDPITGEVDDGQLFVGALGASNYTYCEVCRGQDIASWVMAHIRMFEHFGGVPELLVPDNLKSGVKTACLYDPEVNATYAEMAEHYGAAVLPTRTRKPRDKAKVESAVLIAERWILARLRKRTFFSLAEANEAVAELLDELNARPFDKLPGCRDSLFDELDRPALQPLPDRRYQLAQWFRRKVGVDYHVEVDRHLYSVPHALCGQPVDVRATAMMVEVLHEGRRVASHVRSHRRGRFTTDPAHMPRNHREQAEWTPQRFERWAAKTGPATAEVVRMVMASKSHPEQGYRACLGIMRLGKKHGADRLEAACERAAKAQAFAYKSIKSILDKGLDRQPDPDASADRVPIAHENIRGPAYYGGPANGTSGPTPPDADPVQPPKTTGERR